MPEAWTYRLSDFLMFSPRVYDRLIELHNEAVWPLHVLATAAGLGILVLLRRPSARQGQAIAALLAIAWAWVAWSFLWERFAAINWAILYVVPFFALQAATLLWTGVARGRLRFALGRDAASVAGVAVVLYAVFVHPLVGIAARSLGAAEVVGIAPDPTAIATLGLVLLAPGRVRWELLVIPILWCLFSAATLWALGSFAAWVPLSAAAVTAAAAVWPAQRTLR